MPSSRFPKNFRAWVSGDGQYKSTNAIFGNTKENCFWCLLVFMVSIILFNVNNKLQMRRFRNNIGSNNSKGRLTKNEQVVWIHDNDVVVIPIVHCSADCRCTTLLYAAHYVSRDSQDFLASFGLWYYFLFRVPVNILSRSTHHDSWARSPIL